MPLALDLVSPLPPIRSGIADYTADLLPHLAPLTDLRLLTLPGETPSPSLISGYAARPLATTGPDRSRVALYQMGNNRYHVEVERRARSVPGVVVLHDVVLHHLLLERTVGREPPDLAAYERALAAEHGWIGERVARAKRWGGYAEIASFLLPAHRTLLRGALGVLVHSRWAAERIAEAEPGVRVAVVPMGVPLPPLPDGSHRAATRARLGIPATALVLGSFGFQTPIKRTELAIQALAGPGMDDVHLLIAGEGRIDHAAQARAAGVGARVHVMGYLPFAAMEEAIAAADVSLNLRYPTAGETSASLLRILALGGVAMVSDHAQFAELPDEVVVKVPLAGAAEVPALVAAIAGLRRDSERRARIGAAAREHVARRHAPAAAAAAIVARCGEWGTLAPVADPADAPAFGAAPATTLTGQELGGALRVEGAEAPWAAGERRHLRVVLENTGPVRWLAARRGDGGVAIEVRLEAGGSDLRADEGWLPLPHDLAPGETCSLEVALRRPAGAALLRVVPHVAGRGGMAAFGGPQWASAL